MPMDRFCASVRITGDSLDPSRVTELTGLAPSSAFKRGDTFGKHRLSGQGHRKYGSWRYTEESTDPSEFSEVIRRLLRLTPPDLVKLLGGAGTTADVFVGMFDVRDQSTFEIDADVMKELGARNWPICYDLYT